MNDTREVHVNGGLKQSWELRTADPLKEIVGQSNNSKYEQVVFFSDYYSNLYFKLNI